MIFRHSDEKHELDRNGLPLSLGEMMLDAVFALGAPVDNQEIGFFCQRHQRVVPDAAVVIYSLCAVADKGPHGRRGPAYRRVSRR